MTRIHRLLPLAAVLVSPILVQPVTASEPVVVDPAGDARPERCEPVAGTCHRLVEGDSQAAADIVSVNVVPVGGEFGVEIAFLDVDRPISKVGPEAGDIQTSVSFRLGGRRDTRWAWVWLSVVRDFSGALRSPTASVTVGTYGGNDEEFSRRLSGSAVVDTASNRLRVAVPLSDVRRAVDEMCPGCGSLAPGSELWSFFAESSAYSYVGSGLSAVGVQTVARDTGWPGDRSYTL